MRALVITGGTEVDIDDVRVLTNRSKGRMGCNLANALNKRGVDVTVLGAERTLAHGGWLDEGVITVPFRTFAHLEQAMQGELSNPYDFVFMPAAVSDFSVPKATGKLSSTDTLQMGLRKTPKLLRMVRRWSTGRPFIVGWKLLVDATDEDLYAAAMTQITDCRINLTVANNWGNRSRKCWAVTPEGGMLPIEGDPVRVAGQIVDFCMKRQAVTWSSTSNITSYTHSESDLETRRGAAEVLTFAQNLHLLDSGTAGNVTHVVDSKSFWATPRGVDKSLVTEKDLIRARWYPATRTVYAYDETRKPSIDCSVHGTLYQRLRGLESLVHFHDGYVVPNTTTTYPYPCGTAEEAEEIIKALAGYPTTWLLKMVHHGYLLGLGSQSLEDLMDDWIDVQHAWEAHITKVGYAHLIPDVVRFPVFAWGRIGGIVIRWAHLHSCFLLPGYRRQGIGRVVAEKFIRDKSWVVAHDDCKVEEFYLQHGYTKEYRDDPGLNVLRPPG